MVEETGYSSINLNACPIVIWGYDFSVTPWVFILRLVFELISKVLTPSDDKLSVTECSIPSIVVSIPTRAVMPIATMRAVSTDLNRLACMERKPSLIFSIRFMGRETSLYTEYVD